MGDGLKWALASSAVDVTVCSDLLESMRTAHLNVETAKAAVAACQKLLQEATTTRTNSIRHISFARSNLEGRKDSKKKFMNRVKLLDYLIVEYTSKKKAAIK